MNARGNTAVSRSLDVRLPGVSQQAPGVVDFSGENKGDPPKNRDGSPISEKKGSTNKKTVLLFFLGGGAGRHNHSSPRVEPHAKRAVLCLP